MMKIVILGGVAAGAKAAAKAKRLQPDAEINIYTDDTHVSYSACGMPYYIEGNFDDYKMLLVRSPEEFEEQGIHVHLKHRAAKIMPNCKQVLIENLDTNRATLVEYDKLIIAIGARPSIPPIKNVNLNHVYTLRKIPDAIAIKEKALTSKHATIVGGGYIGIELLEAFVRQGLKVTLVEAAPTIMSIFDDDMSKLIEEQLNSINKGEFEIFTSELVTELIGDNNGVHTVKTGSGRVFETDLVVLCTGVVPNIDIARDAGIQLSETGAIKVNDKMETSMCDIYACGDCVDEYNLISKSRIWLPLGANANKEGRCAAMNACGIEDYFHGVLGSAVTRCLGFTMSMTGLSVKDAQMHGFNPIWATVTKHDKVGYMPDVNNITLKLVADKSTHKLIGGQAVGAGDADKRINTLTSALLAELTVEDFIKNDLTYAPPYSPTIDPLLNAAQILQNKLNR